MIIDRLYDAVSRKGPVCVGLDTSEKLLPERLRTASPLSEAILEFNRAIVDATLDVAACYKVQIAHYEALGTEGLACYRDTLSCVRKKGALVIGDVKRGDIASTGEMYARAHFSGEFEADFVTLNPYMGGDVIAPFEPYLKKGQKGLFVLTKTSNPTSADIQDLRVGTQPVYMHVAQKLTAWGRPYGGACGYGAIGAVVGATQQEELVALRRGFPSLFFLIPGYGAQGGGGRDVAPAFVAGNGAVVNASRSILGAHRGRPDGDDRYAEYARQAVVRMRKDIARWTDK